MTAKTETDKNQGHTALPGSPKENSNFDEAALAEKVWTEVGIDLYSDEDVENEIVEHLAPWPEPVDGKELINTIYETVRKYVHLTEPQLVAVSTWCLGTFCMDYWRLWPKLFISSPLKRCGKSTLMLALEAFLHKPLAVSNISTAAFHRVIEFEKPTLLIDEADTFVKGNHELNGIINGSHLKRTAKVVRAGTSAQNFEPQVMSTWSATIISGIGSQRGTLVDRSICIEMRRKTREDEAEKLPLEHFEDMQHIRRKCLRWADDNGESLKRLRVGPPNMGSDRAQDNWSPMVAIAEAVGGEWPERVRRAYLAFQSNELDDDDLSSILLNDIRVIVDDCDVDQVSIFSCTLVSKLISIEDAPWSEFNNGKPLSQHSLAKMLSKFKIKPKVVQLGAGKTRSQKKGYEFKQLLGVFRTYLPSKSALKPVTPLQPSQTIGYEAGQTVAKEINSDGENVLESRQGGPCNAATILPMNETD